jgi:hypothetical protein
VGVFQLAGNSELTRSKEIKIKSSSYRILKCLLVSFLENDTTHILRCAVLSIIFTCVHVMHAQHCSLRTPFHICATTVPHMIHFYLNTKCLPFSLLCSYGGNCDLTFQHEYFLLF